VKYDFTQAPEYLRIADDIIGSHAHFVGMQHVYTIAIFDNACEFMAVVLYTDYTGMDIAMHIASVSPKWATRESLRVIFTYPFVELGVQRVSAATKQSYAHALEALRRVGFVREGELRNYHEDGDSDIISGMLKEECRWI